MDKLTSIPLILFICMLAFSCADEHLDTSWRVHQGVISDDDPASKLIQPGEDAWRLVKPAKPGEKLPDGQKAGDYDVLWEWRMELTNISKISWQIKTRFYLVTVDKVNIAVSEFPWEKDKWIVLEPGEKKLFTGQGFVDKKDISRIERGRGLIGKQPLKKTNIGPGKETGN